jgi:hypothetical protein
VERGTVALRCHVRQSGFDSDDAVKILVGNTGELS